MFSIKRKNLRLEHHIEELNEVSIYGESNDEDSKTLLENKDFKDTYPAEQSEIRNTHINIGTGVDISIRELAESLMTMRKRML